MVTLDSVSVLVGRILSPIDALLAGCSAAEFRQDLTRGKGSAEPPAAVVRIVIMAMGWTGAFLAIVAVLFAAVPFVDHSVIAPILEWCVRLPITSDSMKPAVVAAGSASYAYDVLGRALSVPQVDISGSSPVVTGLTYFANDLVATESQTGGVSRTFGLDVLRRLNTWTDTVGATSTVVTNHYDGSGDSPAWTTSSDGTTTTTSRNIPGPDGNLALTTNLLGTGTVTATLNIVNPHGDVFTTIPDVVNVTAAQVGACNDTDEFGVTLTPSAPSYGWVGGKLRATNTATGLIQMGVRVYDPVTGRFLSTDPVYGGNDNTYTYPVDPVNSFDLDGNLGAIDCGHGRCKSDPADAERALDTISLGMGVAAMAGCGPCGGVALGINAYQTYRAARNGDWGEATASAVGFFPGIGRFGSRLMAVRYATKISRSYTIAGHALKLRRTALRRAMKTWYHRQRTWGRVLDYASLTYESARYGQKYGW